VVAVLILMTEIYVVLELKLETKSMGAEDAGEVVGVSGGIMECLMRRLLLFRLEYLATNLTPVLESELKMDVLMDSQIVSGFQNTRTVGTLIRMSRASFGLLLLLWTFGIISSRM